jgi:hypothetical protein
LLPVLESPHQTVTVIGFESQPFFCRRIGLRKSGGQVEIAIVTRECEKAAQLRTQAIGRSKVQRVIAFENVEGPAIRADATERGRDVDIRVGISICVF